MDFGQEAMKAQWLVSVVCQSYAKVVRSKRKKKGVFQVTYKTATQLILIILIINMFHLL